MLNMNQIVERYAGINGATVAAFDSNGVVVLDTGPSPYVGSCPELSVTFPAYLLVPSLNIDVNSHPTFRFIRNGKATSRRFFESGFCHVSELVWMCWLLTHQTSGNVKYPVSDYDYLTALPMVNIHDDTVFEDALFLTRVAHTYRPDMHFELNTYVPAGTDITCNQVMIQQGAVFLLNPDFVHNTALPPVPSMKIDDFTHPVVYDQLLIHADWVKYPDALAEFDELWQEAKRLAADSYARSCEVHKLLQAKDPNTLSERESWLHALPVELRFHLLSA